MHLLSWTFGPGVSSVLRPCMRQTRARAFRAIVDDPHPAQNIGGAHFQT